MSLYVLSSFLYVFIWYYKEMVLFKNVRKYQQAVSFIFTYYILGLSMLICIHLFTYNDCILLNKYGKFCLIILLVDI